MQRLNRIIRVVASAFALAGLLCTAHAQTFCIGLAGDPDILDPTLGRTLPGRTVFAALCDRLFDIDEHLNIVPQLATGYQWSPDRKALTLRIRQGVTFHDGEKLDAAAVRFNLERHKTMPGSSRRGELAPIASVDVVDPLYSARVRLSAPFGPLIGLLSENAGVMVSPKAALASGDKFGTKPVCSGPFRFVQPVAQDRIVLERNPSYWNRGDIHVDRIVYLPIPDATVRLANLRSGQLDIIEGVAPSDLPQLKNDARFKIANSPGLVTTASRSISARATLRRKTRWAATLGFAKPSSFRSIARESSRWQWTARQSLVNEWVAPTNPYYAKNMPVPKRDLARGKALLREAGVPNPHFTLMTSTGSVALQVAQVVQAMAREAGFDIKIQANEFATSLDLADKGQFDAYLVGWSGRTDPDGNVFRLIACNQPLNAAGYCNPEVDDLLLR